MYSELLQKADWRKLKKVVKVKYGKINTRFIKILIVSRAL